MDITQIQNNGGHPSWIFLELRYEVGQSKKEL